MKKLKKISIDDDHNFPLISFDEQIAMKGGSGPGTPFPIGPVGWSLIAEAASWLFGSGNSGGSGNDGGHVTNTFSDGNITVSHTGNNNVVNFTVNGQVRQIQIMSADSIKIIHNADGSWEKTVYGPTYSGGSN